MIRGRSRDVLRDTELRVYLSILLVGSAIVIVSLLHAGTAVVTTDGRDLSSTVGNAVRHGAFTAISVQTTTGFCTADFDLWPFLARGVCVALMFIGGSAGSTGGGLKVIRIIICFKVILAEIERAFRPRVVRPVKVNRAAIDPDLKLATVAYVLGVIVLFLAGAGLVMALEPADHNCNFITAATASVATLFNIGPGLGGVGAVQNYAWFTDSSKLVLSILMVIGRLEVFAIAVLFVPRFWRGD
jgi:trk system potassium uptake protein TrkH